MTEWWNGRMAEWRNGRITEQQKMTPNPKRWNHGMAEWWKIPRNPTRRNDGKSPKFLKDRMTENHLKS